MFRMRELNSIEEVKKELKRLAAIKCRLKKQPGKKSYEEDMQKVLAEEEAVKEIRDSLVEGKKTVTNYTEADIAELSYEETIRAIKSIQSKKSLTKWLTEVEGDNAEYRKAVEIEKLLKEHRDVIAPTAVTVKSKLQDIINGIESGDSIESVLIALKELVK